VAVFATLLIVEYAVVPQLAGAGKSLHLLRTVNPWWLLAGAGLEAAALLSYAQLTRAVLPQQGNCPGLFDVVRIDLSTLAVSHVVPGGSAAGTSLGYRLLTEAGVSGADAGFAVATQGIGSAIVLNLLLWIGLVISLPTRGFNPLYGTAAIAGIVLLGGFAGLVLLLTRGQDHAKRVLQGIARRVPFLHDETVQQVVTRLAERLGELADDRPLLLRATGWAAANWVLDAASLWVFVLAFGHTMSPDGLLVSYALANVLAAIPVTPGGLGIVEGVLTSLLVGFGAPRGPAILGVLGWRLVNFWLPIPAGALAYLSLRVEPGAPPERKAAELEQLARRSAEDAEDRRTWATRLGLRPPRR
jgi:uncharacterized protein (TIRG00374 family)